MAHYRLTSTVMLSLTTDNESSGTFSLSGSIRRQVLYTLFCFILSSLIFALDSACWNIHLKVWWSQMKEKFTFVPEWLCEDWTIKFILCSQRRKVTLWHQVIVWRMWGTKRHSSEWSKAPKTILKTCHCMNSNHT